MAGGQITTAVIGLCGVFVGGLITAGANWLLAVRKEWADAREKRESEAKELQTVARLVKQDFEHLSSYLSACLKADEWLPITPRALSAWDNERGVLARALPDDAWKALTRASAAAQVATHAMNATGEARERPKSSAADVELALAHIDAGRAALEPFTRYASERLYAPHPRLRPLASRR